MNNKIIFNKDAIGQIKAIHDDIFIYQRGRSTYEINKIHIFDNGKKLVSFNAKHLLDDAARNIKGCFKGIQFPYILKNKHRVNYLQNEAYCISLGKNHQGVLIADLFIPKIALVDFKEHTIIKKNEIGDFTRTFIEFNGFCILIKLNYSYELEKVKVKAIKNINKFLKEINEATTIEEINKLSNEFDLKLYS